MSRYDMECLLRRNRVRGYPTPFVGVYFLKWTEFVKIGYAGDVAKRCAALRWSIPTGTFQPLAWIYTSGRMRRMMDGERAMEQDIHALLAEHQAHGEWFHYNDAVRTFIDAHGMPWPVPWVYR